MENELLKEQIRILAKKLAKIELDISRIKPSVQIPDNRISSLVKQVSELSQQISNSNVVRKIIPENDEKISTISKQLVAMKQEIAKMPKSAQIRQIVTDSALSKKIAQLESRMDKIAPSRLDHYAILNEKITAITKQVSKVVANTQISLQKKYLTEEKVTALAKQVNLLKKQIENMPAMAQKAPELPKSLLDRINGILEEIKIYKEGEAVYSGSYILNITEPGDTWMGTIKHSSIYDTSKIMLNVYPENIVTRVSGETTGFDITLVKLYKGGFDWMLESYAKVFSGKVNILYYWTAR